MTLPIETKPSLEIVPIPTRPLSAAALSILTSLTDGEWHPVAYRCRIDPDTVSYHHRVDLDRLERRKLINLGCDDDGRLVAIATDSGLAAIEPIRRPGARASDVAAHEEP